jgi:hypothetical protein
LSSHKEHLAIVSFFTKCGLGVDEDDEHDEHDGNDDDNGATHQKHDSHVRKYICLFGLFS